MSELHVGAGVLDNLNSLGSDLYSNDSILNGSDGSNSVNSDILNAYEQDNLDLIYFSPAPSPRNKSSSGEPNPNFFTSSGVPVYSPTATMLLNAQFAAEDVKQETLKGTKRKWTAEEDLYINNMVKANGPSNWSVMARQLQRTGPQCSQRWNKVLNPAVLHNVKWSAEEDRLLLQLHELHPNWQNKQFAAALSSNRTPTQCSNRWNNKLDPRLRWGPWTDQEDAALVDGRSKGQGWSAIVKTYPSLKNRANIAAKNRFSKLQKLNEKKK